jgi:hypothetical protein
VASGELTDLRAHGRGAGEADLVHEPLVQGALQTLEGARAVALDEIEDAVREPARDEQVRERVAQRGRVLGRLPDHGVPAQDRRDEIPGRHRHREVPGRDDRGHPDGHAEGEELFVRHLARNGLAVEAPPLREEEVAGVDDLLDLAERLRVGLADLAGDEAREGLLVVLHEAADLLDDVAAHRCRDRRPLALSRTRRAAGIDEGVGVAEDGLADQVVEVRGIARLDAPPVAAALAADDRSDSPRLGDAHIP